MEEEELSLDQDSLIPTVKIGDSGVGKTSLLSVYNKDYFPEKSLPTISVEFGHKKVVLSDGSKLKVQIFDTAGQEKYRSIVSSYCRKALGCLLVYDITKENSFKQCKVYIEEVKQMADPSCIYILIGNKIDLEDKREVSQEEAKLFSENNNILFFETSAKNKQNVNDVFKALLEKINTETKKKYNQMGLNNYMELTHKNNVSSKGTGCCC